MKITSILSSGMDLLLLAHNYQSNSSSFCLLSAPLGNHCLHHFHGHHTPNGNGLLVCLSRHHPHATSSQGRSSFFLWHPHYLYDLCDSGASSITPRNVTTLMAYYCWWSVLFLLLLMTWHLVLSSM